MPPSFFRCLLLLGTLGIAGFTDVHGQADDEASQFASDPRSIERTILEAYQSGLHIFVIPPGIYRVGADPRSGAHLHFEGMKNFEIDATGVTLIFTSSLKGDFDFSHCENVTLRGATLLRETLPFSQGTITAIGADRKTCDVQADQGYPTDFSDPAKVKTLGLDLYDRQTREWQAETSGSLEALGPGRFRCHVGNLGAPGWRVGAPVAWRGAGGADIRIGDCSGMQVLDVTIKGGAGFCVLEYGGAGGNHYRYTVTYSGKPPGADAEPLMASNADAFHSSGVRKGPTLENCHFEGMNDDGIPIHGQYALVEAAVGAQMTLEVRNPPFCQAGDHLRFLDAQDAVAGDAKVVAVQPLPGYQPPAPPPKRLRLFQETGHAAYEQVKLDQPIPASFGWMVANADANGDGFLIRHCTVGHNRARGMLIKASDGVIEDCTVNASSMGGIIVAPEIEFWNESDYARNIVIRNNRIIDCDYWDQQGTSQSGALSVVAHGSGGFVPLPGGHRNILIEGNTFEDNNGPNIVISSTEGIVIRNNRFIRPMWQANDRGKAAHIDPHALIWLTQSNNVQLSGNVVAEPGPFLLSKIVATSSVTGTGLTDGVTVAP